MSQDEHHAALPGHADFTLPQPAPPKPVNGKRPIPMPDPPPAARRPRRRPQAAAAAAAEKHEHHEAAEAGSDEPGEGTATPPVRKPANRRRPVAHTDPAETGAETPATPEPTVPRETVPSEPVVAGAADAVDVWDQRVARGLAFLRRRLAGAYEVDDFGFDPELTDAVFHPMLRVLYRDWFRTEVFGVEHVPETGGGLVVGNHSGTLALDALMLTTALRDKHPGDRHLRLLGADLVFRMPVLSELARKAGATVACNPDAERLMSSGELVGVFPEGFKGIGKRYAERYKLQRFGRGGFVSAALRTGTPIVPVAIVGAEEIYPILADLKPLARLLGIPYFPVTPTFPWLGPLGLVPLPSKWLIEFCPPIPTAHLTEYADDPMVVFNLADQVRETIQATLYSLLEKRPDPFGR
ncbi:lysophospholipid acyltransferase family protein [Actinoplanes sp. NPDC049548]|uniref:lysophospholipid acyltransferase family protein n=1 Tax=Actinoplanes sp. NPDC049548 TaxID=3155152 RepID=UPI00341319DC